ncbi:hypothetical protein [Paenibacillus harenae]|uniref:Uncharacterized protein n=1 Tax=Paenibacillus harenae TaxID=306543 RepID=A0ABT9U7H4_PAEHA|nr:hypothetical protein [Paenibacillus harenae]MDQ0115596.1 hypothetical protein [Paenibacillus harenae]
MQEKIIVLLIVYILALSTDILKLRNSPVRGRIIYWGIMVITLYFSTDYLLKAELPDLHMFADLLFTKPARMIVEFLRVEPT